MTNVQRKVPYMTMAVAGQHGGWGGMKVYIILNGLKWVEVNEM